MWGHRRRRQESTLKGAMSGHRRKQESTHKGAVSGVLGEDRKVLSREP